MIIISLTILFILLFVLLAVLTFARDLWHRYSALSWAFSVGARVPATGIPDDRRFVGAQGPRRRFTRILTGSMWILRRLRRSEVVADPWYCHGVIFVNDDPWYCHGVIFVNDDPWPCHGLSYKIKET